MAQGLPWTVSVNVSARHCRREDFASRLKAVLADYPSACPSLLELEILEPAADAMPWVTRYHHAAADVDFS